MATNINSVDEISTLLARCNATDLQLDLLPDASEQKTDARNNYQMNEGRGLGAVQARLGDVMNGTPDPAFSLVDENDSVVSWLKKTLPAWLLKLIGMAPPDAPGPTPQQTTQDTAYAAHILSNDTSLWQNKIYLDIGDLKDIVKHPSQHKPDTVKAAQIMLDNPEEFSKADGANTNGRTDGEIWNQDLVKYAKMVTMATPAASDANAAVDLQETAHAAHVLAGDSQLWQAKNYLDIGDLKDIVAHPSQHGRDTVAAAQVMLDNPAEFSKADGANTDGRTDGEIWKHDLVKYAKDVTMLAPHANPANQDINVDDDMHLSRYMAMALDAAAQRAFQKQAAQDTPEVTENGPQAQQARQVLMNNESLWVGKNTLKAHDLQQVLAKSQQYPPELIAAVLYLLQHPEAMGGPAGIDDPAAIRAAQAAFAQQQRNEKLDLAQTLAEIKAWAKQDASDGIND